MFFHCPGTTARMDIGNKCESLINSLRTNPGEESLRNLKGHLQDAIRESQRPIREGSKLTHAPYCALCDSVFLTLVGDARGLMAPEGVACEPGEYDHVPTVASVVNNVLLPLHREGGRPCYRLRLFTTCLLARRWSTW